MLLIVLRVVHSCLLTFLVLSMNICSTGVKLSEATRGGGLLSSTKAGHFANSTRISLHI